MSCSRRPQLPIRIASAPRWRPARRRISRAPSYRGRHMANPGTTNAHGGWRSVCVSTSTIWDDGIMLPDPTGCQAGRRRFPYRIHTHCSSPARMTGCTARCRVARHREAAIIGTCLKTSLGRLGQSGCKRWRGTLHQTDHRPPIIGIRNSLQIPCSSLKIPC
jgi:hypothetical protein